MNDITISEYSHGAHISLVLIGAISGQVRHIVRSRFFHFSHNDMSCDNLLHISHVFVKL